MILVILALTMILVSSIAIIVAPVTTMLDESRTQLISDDIAAFASAISEQQATYGGGFHTPVSIKGVAGYEHLRLRDHHLVQFATASNLNESGLSFDRLAIWFESPHDYVGNTQYLTAAENTCSDGDFATDATWCGRSNSIWTKAETRFQFSAQILGEQQRMARTMAKFYRDYSAKQSFVPGLAVGAYAQLPLLVGYAGTAINCGGEFVLGDIILNCADLFNHWGYPITLNKRTDQHIFLVNRTALTRDGATVRLAEEAKME